MFLFTYSREYHSLLSEVLCLSTKAEAMERAARQAVSDLRTVGPSEMLLTRGGEEGKEGLRWDERPSKAFISSLVNPPSGPTSSPQTEGERGTGKGVEARE